MDFTATYFQSSWVVRFFCNIRAYNKTVRTFLSKYTRCFTVPFVGIKDHGSLCASMETTISNETYSSIRKRIQQTDAEIDKMVYNLYELTNEDIAFVERSEW